MELRYRRPEGPRLLPALAVSALGDYSTRVTWQLFKKRCLMTWSDSPEKQLRKVEKTKGEQQSQRFRSQGS